MNRLSLLFVLTPLAFPQAAWAESCDNAVSFSNGHTTKNLTAKVTCVDDQDRLRRIVHLVDGKRHGLETTYWQGQKQREADFANSKLHGEVRRFDRASGALTDIETYVKGRKTGLYTRLHPDGSTWERTWVTPGGRDSKMTWDKSGNLVYMNCGDHPIDAEHKAACIGGTVTFHYGDGSIKVKQSFKDGKLQGKRTQRNPDGSLYRVEHYREGKLDGPQSYYRRDGTLEAEEVIEDGSLVGTQRVYHPDGTRIADQWTVTDGQVVERERFYQNGHRSERRLRSQDQIVVTRYEDAEGKKSSEGAYASRERCGRNTLCYGNALGEHRTYHPSGAIATKTLYENGVLSERTLYDKQGLNPKHERYYPDGSRK